MKMEPGLWTGFFLTEAKTLSLESLLNDISRLKKAGFQCGELDERNAYQLFVELSEKDAIKNAKELNKQQFFTQIHLPKPTESIEKQLKCEQRLIMACEIMKIQKAVTHPYITLPNQTEPLEQSMEYLNRLVTSALKANINIGLENQIYPVTMDRYLSELPALGVTLDFAHGIASGDDIPQLIRKYGKRLYCLHVSDSDGRKDDYHVMPGKGILDWKNVIQALSEVQYEGDFHLEIVHERSNDPKQNDLTAEDAMSAVRAVLNEQITS